MISGLVGSSSSSHPRYHPVQPEHQAAADRRSRVNCSAQAAGRPQSNLQPQSTQQPQPTLQHSQQGADTVLGGCTPQHAAPAGIVVPGSSSGSSSSRAIGGSSGSSSSITGTPPLLLGATRVRFCCPGCLQPDVFVGKHTLPAPPPPRAPPSMHTRWLPSIVQHRKAVLHCRPPSGLAGAVHA
jgi:hypothetical protein